MSYLTKTRTAFLFSWIFSILVPPNSKKYMNFYEGKRKKWKEQVHLECYAYSELSRRREACVRHWWSKICHHTLRCRHERSQLEPETSWTPTSCEIATISSWTSWLQLDLIYSFWSVRISIQSFNKSLQFFVSSICVTCSPYHTCIYIYVHSLSI